MAACRLLILIAKIIRQKLSAVRTNGRAVTNEPWTLYRGIANFFLARNTRAISYDARRQASRILRHCHGCVSDKNVGGTSGSDVNDTHCLYSIPDANPSSAGNNETDNRIPRSFRLVSKLAKFTSDRNNFTL